MDIFVKGNPNHHRAWIRSELPDWFDFQLFNLGYVDWTKWIILHIIKLINHVWRVSFLPFNPKTASKSNVTVNHILPGKMRKIRIKLENLILHSKIQIWLGNRNPIQSLFLFFWVKWERTQYSLACYEKCTHPTQDQQIQYMFLSFRSKEDKHSFLKCLQHFCMSQLWASLHFPQD